MKRGLKITLIVTIIVITLINIPIIGGLFLPKSHKITKTLFLKYDPENIWVYITNVEHYPKWRPSVKKVEVVSTNPAGLTSWQEFYRFNRHTMFQVTEANPYTDLIIKTADKESYYYNKWSINIKEAENGSLLTITEEGEISNPLFRSIAKLKGVDQPLTEYINDLKTGLSHQ
jgi:ribosome-associated toxin RatA of RatAB toxin-antitoxin module